MSEKTLEEEILITICRGIEEADRIRGEFTQTDDIDRNLNGLSQRITASIFSLVVAKLEKILDNYYRCDNSACGNGAVCNYCALRADITNCIQAIRGK